MIVDPDFCDHWKTRTLVGMLDADEAAPVYILRLWAHCQNRRQWTFENLTTDALKALCHFPGHANKLESSLVTSGFVRRNEDQSLTVCNWDEYNASLIAAWVNGSRGGRPSSRKPKGKPTGSRLDKSRCDGNRGEKKVGGKPPKTPGNKKPSATFDEAAIPENIRVPRFVDAWRRWLIYRKERSQPVTPQGQEAAFIQAEKIGAEVAAEKLIEAMANGWQGWKFKEQEQSHGNKSTRKLATGAGQNYDPKHTAPGAGRM